MVGTIHVEIGGKQRPFRWGTNATRLLWNNVDSNIISTTVATVYAGLYAGAKHEGVEVDFDMWKVADWVDEIADFDAFDAFIDEHIKANTSPVMEHIKKKMEQLNQSGVDGSKSQQEPE